MLLRVTRDHQFLLGEKSLRCAVGRSDFTTDKREGDGATPIGEFALRSGFYRADKLGLLDTDYPFTPIQIEDGWCDAPKHAQYNQKITVPFDASHERLWREDGVYDIIIPIGYNDDPIEPGRGSAIFMHLAKPDYEPTEGCVALSFSDMLLVLKAIDLNTRIKIGD